MKHLFLRGLLLGLIVTLLSVTTGRAQSGIRTLEGDDAALMLSILRELPYIADGKDNGKRVYVFFTPTCQYCRMLFDGTRTLTDQVQLRWILCSDQPSLHGVYDHLTPDTVEAVFNKTPLPNTAPEINARIHRYSMGSIFFLLVKGYFSEAPSNFAFPTMIYGEGDTVKIVTGLPTDTAGFIRELPFGEPEPTSVPATIRLAERPVALTPISRETEYKNSHSSETPILLMPFDDAPLIGAVNPNAQLTGIPVVGVSAEGHIALSFDKAVPHLYIKDQSFADELLKALP